MINGDKLINAQKIIKNTGIMLVGNLLFRFISLFITVYLAKYLGVENFGKYSFVFVYLGFFTIFIDLGTTTILVRQMARNIESMPKMIGNVHIIKTILSVVIIFIAVIVSSKLYSKEMVIFIFIASFTLLFQAFSDTYGTVFQTTLNMKYDVAAKLTFKIISAILILYIIFIKGTLLQILIILSFSEFIKTLLYYLFSRRVTKAKFNIDFTLWKSLLKQSLPVALYSIFLIIYSRIDVLMLSVMKDEVAIGLYSAAYNLSEPLILIPYSIVASLFPLMSQSFTTSVNTLKKYYEMGLRYTIITMLPITIGTTLLADRIILLIYGQLYVGSIIALKILIWSLLITSNNYLLTSLLISMNKEKFTTLNMIICVFSNIVLNYFFIFRYSYVGASLATVMTSFVYFMLNYRLISKNNVNVPIITICKKPLIAGSLMGLYVYSLNLFTTLDIYLIVLSAAIVYMIGLLAVGTFPKEEILTWKKGFQRPDILEVGESDNVFSYDK